MKPSLRSAAEAARHRKGKLASLGLGLLLIAMLSGLSASFATADGPPESQPSPQLEDVATEFGGETAEPAAGFPTAQQTREAIEAAESEHRSPASETDPKVAEELPHRDLNGEEALALAEGVFGARLEDSAGIFAELEPDRFLSDYAAIVPASSLPDGAEESEEGLPVEHPNMPVLLESSLPLRTENSSGQEEVVSLQLERSEGELQPANPLAEVGIPQELGEGISLTGPEVEITVGGAPAGKSPIDANGQFAFYPNVSENSDLIVAPTPTGVETLTDIRSAEAPMQTTYHLALPQGAEVIATKQGGAEVIEGGDATVLIPPPTAVDAEGNPVRAELSVEGEAITIETTPDASTSFPILVDPNFLYENSDWAFGHASMAGWTGSTTNSSATLPVPYWIWNSAYPGLDLSWGFGGNAHNGDTSSWGYTVPRYSEDASVGKTPSTWLYTWTAEDIFFSKQGNNAGWPALIWGITSPGGWVKDHVHTGSEAEWNTWHNGETIVNEGSDHSAKSALMALLTGEEEDPAKRRDAYIGASYMVLVDEDAPTILKLEGPAKWVNTTPEPITYQVEDNGLGVKQAWASYEANPEPGWGFELPCAGTNATPCPRVARSGTAGKDETQAALHYDPTVLPTGKDRVAFAFGDPIWGLSGDGAHTAGGIVVVKVDHTAPEVTLSGALTEEEKLGTLKSEYPLTIKAADGTEADPQSGVAKVEVKVDGKAKQTWNPGCATENCPFSGSWTLKTSEFTAASHEVEVLVTDAAGVVSESTIEIDLGEAPPQTSFTSPHPSFEAGELASISFKATRGGAPVSGATYRCSLDEGETPIKPCSSPFTLPKPLGSGPHTFSVAAVDSAGQVDPTPARWKFETGAYPAAPSPSEKLVYPETGQTTASYYTLEAEWGGNPEGKAAEGVTGVSFEIELPGWSSFKLVPEGCVIDGEGHQVSWPLRPQTHPGHNKPVYLKVRGCPVFEAAKYPEKEVQFRAVFDGGTKVAGASPAVSTEFVYNANTTRVPTDAVAAVGPASVDLLTGAFTLSRTDVSIPVPGYQANLEFTRVYHSSADGKLPGTSLVLGGAWQPSSPLESEGEGEAWTRIEEVVIPAHPAVYGKACWNAKGEETACGAGCNPESCEEWLEEEAQPEMRWIELFDNEGAGIPFEIVGEHFVAPDWAKELNIYKEGGNFVLASPNGAHTTFISDGEGHFVPKYISYQATPGSLRIVYESLSGGKGLRLVKEIAPAPVTCPEASSHMTPGCRTLTFNYGTHTLAGGGSVVLLESITYWGPTGNPEEAKLVATYGYTEMASPSGGPGIALTSATEPRAGLTEKYTYASSPYSNDLASLKPPGQEPWKFNYEYNAPGYPNQGEKPTRLRAVSRGTATTTLAYEVPVKGAGAPYDMSPENISKWGQTDLPVDATAIFPPNHVPAGSPPSSYTGATVHYMDPEGHEVNTAQPSPPEVTGASITTAETDMKGNVVRELSAQNRLRALEAAEPAARSHELDTHSVYNANGTELLESWGPLHEVRLESGEIVQARRHMSIRYDEGEPLPPAGTPPAYLPTKETVAAVVPGKEGELEPRVTETHYKWSLRLPEEMIVDPGGLNIRTVAIYNAAGQVIETRQPKGAAGGTAGDMKTVYYTATGNGECLGSPQYANLPCKVLPAAQTSGTGRPQLLVKKFLAYNYLGEPTEVTEAPANVPAEVRKTITTYDSAGRSLTSKTEGGGTAITKSGTVETVYSPTTGTAIKQQFVCEKECTGFDTQATTTTYNSLGQVTRYEDADGAKTETTYDAYGRPATVTDPRGTQTMHYDEASGVLTSMEVSGVGTFTASYNADGSLVKEALPNGITMENTYDETGAATGRTYTKTASCGTSCTWLSFSLRNSIDNQILSEEGTLEKNSYRYDKAGRLIEAQETPAGGNCTTRAYEYDADSNRKAMITREPGLGGACAATGGTKHEYSYDAADRLTDSGIVYDSWGRITKLPGSDAGGKELTTSYFATDMVATQSQNGVTNTYELDASLRQRSRLQAGGLEGTEVFHHDSGSDAPSWTERGTTWSRNIVGIGGELAAIQDSASGVKFQLTNLHGDVIATAGPSPTETKLLATFSSDEFGNPGSGSAGRFGWLGGKQRSTELSSGVIQMGVRSYVPSIGRFLTRDPVLGGSANPYDYANQDPLSTFDLTGEAACQFHQPSVHPHNRVSQTGSFRIQAGAWAHCRRGTKDVSVKATIAGGAVNAGGVSLPIPGQTGPLHECGDAGVKFTCQATAESTVEANPPCGVSWVGEVDVVLHLYWRSRNGTLMHGRQEFTERFRITGICQEE